MSRKTIANNASIKFLPAIEPTVGMMYHLSWAYSGAKFQLVKIIDDKNGEVWTGKTKNKIIKVKLSELLELRKHE